MLDRIEKGTFSQEGAGVLGAGCLEFIGYFWYHSRPMLRLSTRQQSILNRVVDAYIETAQPVGSRLITELYQRLYRSSYSPATVRHEMGRLEELGYLTHPHTSAGRIPTDLGYRYYVDHGLSLENLPDELLGDVEEQLKGIGNGVDSVADRVASLLTALSGEISLVLFPVVRNRVSDTEKTYSLVIMGTSRILEKPEFQDIQKVKRVFKALDEKKEMVEWISSRIPKEGVQISIGRENEQNAFWECTMISTRCSVGKGCEGTMALFGPKRMRYGRLIPLLKQVSRLMNWVLP
ncbi:MAG: hypothetical protein JW893_06845 [Candidatus Omnitrophica bacterium]|nr:hypothetical protein [Candidatus Omnitrophota bacterium]